MYLVTVILPIRLFASQHSHSTFTNISIMNTLASNIILTHTGSYRIYGTHVVTYIHVFAINKDIALSLGLCEASDLITCSMTCMLKVV